MLILYIWAQAAELDFTLRNDDVEGFSPAPFAKSNNWLAIFSGADKLGRPKVIIFDLIYLHL